jgi:hypothetical protein
VRVHLRSGLVPPPPAALTRRTLLALPLLAACTTGGDEAPSPAPVDPDVALRAAAVAREEALLAEYDGLVAAYPVLGPLLGPLRADHAAHLAALAPDRAATPSATPTPPGAAAAVPRAAAVARVVAAERAASREHALGALTASRELAGVLGQLAACEASHAAVLA